MKSAVLNAKALVAEGRHDEALGTLRAAFTPDAEFSTLARAAKWSASVAWPGLRPLKVAFLGGGTLEHLVDFTAFRLTLEGFALVPYLPSYGTWRMEIVNPASGLYRAAPDIVWFFTTRRDLRLHDEDPFADCAAAVSAQVEELEGFWRLARSGLPAAQCVQNTTDPAPERVFGNLEASLPFGSVHAERRFNLSIVDAALREGVAVFDLARLAAVKGLKAWINAAYWFHSKHPFSPELAGWLAYYQAKHLAAAKGASRKVIVLDLDNTLWGGVIGDDGVEGIALGNGADGEAFVAFQRYLKGLARRGIVLAVASKNQEEAAQEPFVRHPDMVLSLDDIAVFKANWRNKADNIREIAEILNLGLDSFVFLDDNPAERALVRAELPMVATPELPLDPAEYLGVLDSLAYFETGGFSSEDRARGAMYRENAARHAVRSSATNLEDYLRGLEMTGSAGYLDAYHLPRMAQLVNKSNQFHLTTTRYTEAELKNAAAAGNTLIRWYGLRDSFGDYGLIAVLLLRIQDGAASIDTWVMSCRVLERGMEEFILRDLCAEVLRRGAKTLTGTYIPSKKNALVAGLYERLGFTGTAAHDNGTTEWSLPLSDALLNQRRAAIPLFIATGTPDETKE